MPDRPPPPPLLPGGHAVTTPPRWLQRWLALVAATGLALLAYVGSAVGLEALSFAAASSLRLASASMGLIVTLAIARPISQGVGSAIGALGRRMQARPAPGAQAEIAHIPAPLMPPIKILWWLVVAGTAIHYLIGFPRRYWQLAGLDRGFHSLQLAQTLDQLGISLLAFSAFHGTLELVVGLSCVTLGVLLFWRRSDHWITLTSSLFLICFCSAEIGLTAALQSIPGRPFAFSLDLLQAIGYVAGLTLLYTFPNGRFALAWTRPLAICFAALCALWLAVPETPFNILNYAIFNRTPIASLVFNLAWLASGMLALTVRYRRLLDADERRRTRWVVAGLWVIAAAMVLVFTLDAAHEAFAAFTTPTAVALYTLRVTPYYLSLTVLALSFFAALVYDRLWDIDLIAGRTLRYTLSSLAVLFVYTMVVVAAQQLILRIPAAAVGALAATLALGLLLLFHRARRTPRTTGTPEPLDDGLTPEAAPQSLTLSGVPLWMAHLGWWVIFLHVLAVYTLGFPHRFGHLMVRPENDGLFSAAGRLSVKGAAALQSLGIAPELYLWLRLGGELLFAAIFVGVALLIYWRKPRDLMALIVSTAMLCYAVGITSFATGLAWRRPLWLGPTDALQSLATFFSLAVLYLFPRGAFAPRWTRWPLLLFATAFIVWMLDRDAPLSFLNAEAFFRTPLLSLGLMGALFGSAFWSLIYRYRRLLTPIERQQVKWVVYGFVIAGTVSLVIFVIRGVFHAWRETAPLPILLLLQLDFVIYWLALGLVPITFAIAILRYRLWDIDLIIRRTLLYGALSTVTATLFGLVVFAVYTLTGVPGLRESTLAAVLATVLVMLLIGPLHRTLQARIDARFDRVGRATRAELRRLGQAVRGQLGQTQIVDTLVAGVVPALKLTRAACLLSATGRQVSVAADGGRAGPDLGLSAAELTALARSEQVTRAPSDAYSLLVPLLHQGRASAPLLGVLALGAHRSEQPFSSAEREALATLADQVSAALVVAELVAQQRAFELSPPGRAQAKAQALAATPQHAVEELDRLAQEAWVLPSRWQLLQLLPQALETEGESALAQLADGFRLLVEGREKPGALGRGLGLITDLTSAQHHPWADSPALAPYRLAADTLAAASLEQIAALTLRLATLPAHREQTTDLAQALGALHPVAHRIGLGLSGEAERRPALEAALQQLRSTPQPGATSLASALVAAAAGNWRALIGDALAQLVGRAILEVRPLQSQVIAQAPVTLLVEIANTGDAPAREITLGLSCPPPAEVEQSALHVEQLLARQALVVEVPVEPCGAPLLAVDAQLTYADPAHATIGRSTSFEVALVAPPRWEGPLPNPYVAGRPLEPGSPVFVGREEELMLLAEHLSQEETSTLLLLGRPRIGKTSLLRKLGSQLGAGAVIVWLDGQGLAPAPDTDTLIRTIAHGIAAALGLPVALLVAEKPAFEQFVQQFLPAVLRQLGERRLVLVLDEFEALEEGRRAGVFHPFIPGYLRALMQYDPRIRFVFVGSRPIGALDMDIWANVLNQALHWRIGCLQDSAVRTLIASPLDGRLHYDEAAVRRIVRLSGGFPYFVQLICREVVQQANATRRTFVLKEHVEAAVPQIFERGEVNLVNIWRTASPTQRAVMVGLAKCEYALSRAPTTASELATVLRNHGIEASPVQLETALRGLVEDELIHLVEEPEDVAGHYRWRLALLGRWLARNRSFADLTDSFPS